MTEEEAAALPSGTRIYHLMGDTPEDDTLGIEPPDCKHKRTVIHKGMPMNIRGCLDCIFWEFTQKDPVDAYYFIDADSKTHRCEKRPADIPPEWKEITLEEYREYTKQE